MILVCPFCTDVDGVERTPLGPGIWSYTCSRSRNHPGSAPYTWEGTTQEAITPDAIGGLAAELSLATDLLACLRPGESWVEYGVVEHRYRLLRPDNYQVLAAHFAPSKLCLPEFDGLAGSSRQAGYSTSVYIAHTLSRMSRRDEIHLQTGPATGPWKTASTISYWALSPAPPPESRLTYQAFTEQYPLSPAA
ncbi:hypothetical protein [Cryptosporangium sp. NPDC048952]|uniref:hypothetical protein n=1 Tax=Cryptosporangium sp. NPDC048952 TaxID=3363961 RepID=UPI0037186CE9